MVARAEIKIRFGLLSARTRHAEGQPGCPLPRTIQTLRTPLRGYMSARPNRIAWPAFLNPAGHLLDVGPVVKMSQIATVAAVQCRADHAVRIGDGTDDRSFHRGDPARFSIRPSLRSWWASASRLRFCRCRYGGTCCRVFERAGEDGCCANGHPLAASISDFGLEADIGVSALGITCPYF